MKRLLTILALVAIPCAAMAIAFIQTRPGALQVAGLTSDNVTASTILVDANGVVQVNNSGTSTENVNINQVGSQSAATNGNGVLAVAGASSQGLIVSTAACSSSTCYVSGVMGSAVSVGTGTSAPFGTTTTLIQGLHINNIQAAAVTATITDGNNIPFVGSTASGSFSIPALSNYDLPVGLIGHVFTSGLRVSVSAGTVSMWVEGKQ